MFTRMRRLSEPPRYVRLYRARPCEPHTCGFPLCVTPELVLLDAFHDFSPDGYSILRTGDVTEIEDGEGEQFWQSILEREGLVGGLALQGVPRLDSVRTAIESLVEHEDCLIIECEDVEEDVEDFYIGRVLLAADTHLVIRHFDVEGFWAPTPSEVEWDDITKVQFATPYIRIFERYAREP